MNTLNKMINDYEVLIHKNWDLATEEQKTRIEVLKNKISQNDYNSTTEGIQVVDDIDD